MGWYGVFLVPKAKMIFSLRSVDEGTLDDAFESLERFFGKYDKMKEDIYEITSTAEESKTFSAKITAKMFGIVDEIGGLPELHPSVFLLYFLHKHGFEIKYHHENDINTEDLEKKGWQLVEYT